MNMVFVDKGVIERTITALYQIKNSCPDHKTQVFAAQAYGELTTSSGIRIIDDCDHNWVDAASDELLGIQVCSECHITRGPI